MEGGVPMEVEKNGVFSYSSSNSILDRPKQKKGLTKRKHLNSEGVFPNSCVQNYDWQAYSAYATFKSIGHSREVILSVLI